MRQAPGEAPMHIMLLNPPQMPQLHVQSQITPASNSDYKEMQNFVVSVALHSLLNLLRDPVRQTMVLHKLR